MKTAILVESLNIKEVPIADGQDVYQYQEYRPNRVIGSDKFMMLDKDAALSWQRIVPIHQFSESYTVHRLERKEGEGVLDPRTGDYVVTENTYIAITEEVQKYLQFPIDTLKRQLDNLSDEVQREKSIITALNKELAGIQEKQTSLEGSFWLRLKFLFTGEMR